MRKNYDTQSHGHQDVITCTDVGRPVLLNCGEGFFSRTYVSVKEFPVMSKMSPKIN